MMIAIVITAIAMILWYTGLAIVYWRIDRMEKYLDRWLKECAEEDKQQGLTDEDAEELESRDFMISIRM